MTEIIYELKTPFDYALKGEKVDASFISITAPSFKQIDKVAPIKQLFTEAISVVMKAETEDEAEQEQADGDEKEGMTGAQCIQVLYRSSVDVTKVFLYAEQLFKSGVALIDGETKLTTPLMEKMSLQDFEGLVGAYIANFIVPSLMDGE